ncbi:hypothetical protein [Gordonia malaquae]|uniref:hypothetical protein n=1 Tax=Gordonia malaquae TaxID=410332 RepID=UPI0030FE4E9B
MNIDDLVLKVETVNQVAWGSPTLWLPVISAMVIGSLALIGVGWQIKKADDRAVADRAEARQLAGEDRTHALDQAQLDRQDNREREFVAWQREQLIAAAAAAVQSIQDAIVAASVVRFRVAAGSDKATIESDLKEFVLQSGAATNALSALVMVVPSDMKDVVVQLNNAYVQLSMAVARAVAEYADTWEAERIAESSSAVNVAYSQFMSAVRVHIHGVDEASAE